MVKNTTGTIQGNQNAGKLIRDIQNIKPGENYPVLTKEEEQKLIEEFKHDPEELKKQLILHNIQLAYSMAKKYASKTDDFDSMVQDGIQGLTEAAQRFEPKRGNKFVTYAFPWVKKRVLQRFYEKNVEVEKRSTSLNTPITSTKSRDEDGELSDIVNDLIDPTQYHIPTVEESISANEQTELCDKLMTQLHADTSLSATEMSVFEDLFYNCEKMIDIMDKYNLTTSGIKDIKVKILSKLKNILASDYDITEYSQIA